jgi:hypothetical protein
MLADKLLPLIEPDDTLWIHDYHLLPNSLISLPGFALEADQIKTIVEGRPQHGVRELVVVFIIGGQASTADRAR